MSKATYIQPGEVIDYVNTGDETLKTLSVVKLGKRVGVTGADIPPGGLGVVHTVGVYELEKAAETIELGTDVYLGADGKITATATGNNPAGWAVRAAAAGDATVRVKIG